MLDDHISVFEADQAENLVRNVMHDAGLMHLIKKKTVCNMNVSMRSHMALVWFVPGMN